MRENNRNSIASIGKLPQFTTMNVIDGQAGIIICSSLIFYSLTIDNILNIIVLLILAGVSIVTLTGENGIISRTQSAIEKTKIAEAEEQANLMLTDKLIGVMSNVSGEHGEIGIASILSELKTEGYIENYGTTGETTITGITLDESEISIAIGGEQELTASFTSSSTTGDYYVVIDGKKYPAKKENNKIVIEKNEITTKENVTTEISDVQTSDESKVKAVKEGTDKVKITGVARGKATITIKYTDTIKTTLIVNVKGNVAITLQSNNDSYGTVATTVNGSYLEGTQITLSDELVTPEEEYKFDGWYINDNKITLETGNKYTVPNDGTTSVTIIASFVEKPKTISESTSGVGYYIKKENEYAIVFADRVAQASTTVTWSDTNTSSCTFPTLTGNENFKTYVISDEEYTDPRFGTRKAIKLAEDNTGTEDRFMAMALSDIDTNSHCWYQSAYSNSNTTVVTETGFNTGKTNTATMITKWNDTAFGSKNGSSSYSDVWGIVQTKYNQGWFVPSKDEWSAFAAYLLKETPNLTTSNYNSTFGLSYGYWSSSQLSAAYAWFATFRVGFCSAGIVYDDTYVRLATTF